MAWMGGNRNDAREDGAGALVEITDGDRDADRLGRRREVDRGAVGRIDKQMRLVVPVRKRDVHQFHRRDRKSFFIKFQNHT